MRKLVAKYNFVHFGRLHFSVLQSIPHFGIKGEYAEVKYYTCKHNLGVKTLEKHKYLRFSLEH